MLKSRDESAATMAESVIGQPISARKAELLQNLDTDLNDQDGEKKENETKYHASAGEVAKVFVGTALADRGITLCGGLSYVVMGHRLDNYLAAFKSVRPLLVTVCMLNPWRAYRAFKCYSRLQRLCGRPYLPDLDTARPLEAANPSDYAFVQRLTRYTKFAGGVYPGEILNCHDVDVKPTEMKNDGVNRWLERILPGVVCVDHMPDAEVYRPAWWLYKYAKEKELVLAIQGSSCYSDWITNLVCNPSGTEGVHTGMYQAALRLDRETKNTVLKFMRQNPDYTVVLTGHSLGGGTATLLGTSWIQSFPTGLGERIRVCSIGAPCVVGQAGASQFKKQIVSVVFGRDIVARLSYGCIRDLLVTLHGLAKASKIKGLPTLADIHALDQESPVRNADPDDEWSDSDGDIENLQELDALEYKIDPDGTVKTQLEMPLLDEIEDDKSTTASSPGAKSSWTTASVQLDVMNPLTATGHERRTQIRKDILSAFVELPVAFAELSRLCRVRAAELDERLDQFRTEPKKKQWWQAALGVCCCDCCEGDAPGAETLNEIQKCNEFEMMNEALRSITEAAVSPVYEMMVPAGRVVMVMPKLSFLECSRPTPSIINRGQCILVEMEGDDVVNLVKEPVWNYDAMKDHMINCYFQGLAPELLRALPAHTSVVTAQVARARAARLNPKIEAMAEFQMNRQIRTPDLDHATPIRIKTPPTTAS